LSIEGHVGPIKKGQKDHKGSSYNVLVKWEVGSQNYEVLDTMAASNYPITLALYARENNLLDNPGWKCFCHIASKERNKIRQMVHKYNVSKGKWIHGPFFEFGIQVPCNVKEAYALDAKNGNTKWQDAMKEEIKIDALLMFITSIYHDKIPYLEGYKNIIVHFVFDVEHDLRHKARLVSGGHHTDPSTDGIYSGVVNLYIMRISITAGEMNGRKIMLGDVSSAYLETYTQEKVCFIAGPEIGPLKGHPL
jgi:hypothetical protein